MLSVYISRVVAYYCVKLQVFIIIVSLSDPRPQIIELSNMMIANSQWLHWFSKCYYIDSVFLYICVKFKSGPIFLL